MVQTMNQELFKVLDETGGMYLPLNADRGMQFNLRRAGASHAADFPAHLQR
jgi:N-acetylglucosamine-6-sulfatase